MKLFRHRPLSSPRSIRIAKILPSADFHSSIEVELIDARLDDHPPYEALSYTWGALNGIQSIVCNARRFLVTPNCESAMRHLRNRRTRLLWIDSICIDQSEDGLQERSLQVTLMGEIYSKAVTTLCWLGPGHNYTPAVMRVLDQIGQCPSERGISKFLRLDKSLDIGESCLNHIYCAPWHTRIWTFQEVAFARKCQVMMGHSSIPWEHYYAAGSFLLFERDMPGTDVRTSTGVVSLDVRQLLREHLARGRGRTDTLMGGLSSVNNFHATDPRDKVYGLYAIYVELGVPFPAVDYTKSVVQVYSGAALALIVSSGSLDILKDVCGVHRHPDLPSWVPDWDDGESRLYMPRRQMNLELARSSAASAGPYRLRVRGSVIGNVTNLHPAFPFDKEAIKLGSHTDPGRTAELLVEWIEYFRSLRRTLSDDELFHDVVSLDQALKREELWELWLDVMNYPKCRWDMSAGRLMAEEWKDADDTEAWSSEILRCATIAAALMGRSIQGMDSPTHDGLVEIIEETQDCLSRRTVATMKTAGGEFMAVVFCMSAAGDCVSLIEGFSWPAVLRAKNESWIFLGPAFVIGRPYDNSWGDKSNLQDFILV